MTAVPCEQVVEPVDCRDRNVERVELGFGRECSVAQEIVLRLSAADVISAVSRAVAYLGPDAIQGRTEHILEACRAVRQNR